MERIAGRISKPPIPVAVIFHGKSATERPLAIAPSLKLQHPISYATIQTHIKSYSLYLNNTKPKHSLLLHYIFSLSLSHFLSPRPFLRQRSSLPFLIAQYQISTVN